MSKLQNSEAVAPLTAAQKALHTAKWARTMTKWLVTHSSKGGVKWKLVDFNGPKGQESAGIVDMIAIRKNHKTAEEGFSRGDLLEIVLIQVKGGSARPPSDADIAKLEAVRKHHNASMVVLTEWKRGQSLRCYVLPEITKPIPASEIFGLTPQKMPSVSPDDNA